MKPATNTLIKITAFLGACACVTYAAIVVGREVTYVHAKVTGSPSSDSRPQELRWPDEVALPRLRDSFLKTVEQPRAKN